MMMMMTGGDEMHTETSVYKKSI